MSRGRLEPPDLDDRTWADIVDQARALIPRYAPEWTDHNPSDPGMALVELFAYLVEGLIYRLNRVPEKHLIGFLDLMGVTRRPARPASTHLVYRIDGSRAQAVVPAGSQVATRQTETAAAVVFETDEPLRVLPVNLTRALLLTDEDGRRYRDVSDRVVRPPLSALTMPLPAGRPTVLALGFDAATTEPVALRVRVLRPADGPQVRTAWLFSDEDRDPARWTELAGEQVTDPSGGLREHTTVTVRVPAGWRAQKPTEWPVQPGIGAGPVDEERFWLALRVDNGTGEAAVLGIESVLVNSVQATNALTVREPESLGSSSGGPLQSFELRRRPLFLDPASIDPLGHVRIEVREPRDGGAGTWTAWRRVDEFPHGDHAVYRLDPVTGTVTFGSFSAVTAPEGHGRIPAAGSEVRAATYRFVAGGAAGNVAAGTVTEIRTPAAGVTTVLNPGPGRGGVDEEPVEQTMRRGPEVLQGRNRAVTVTDFEHLARQASPEVCKARALPPLAAEQVPGELVRSPGVVNVVVLPFAPRSAPRPLPTTALLQQVTALLTERRCIGAEVHVTHPRYLPVDVGVDIRVWQSAVNAGLVTEARYGEEVRDRLDDFLHPLYGGVDGTGWEVGQDATISSLFEAIRPPTEVGFISEISIRAGRSAHSRPNTGGGTAWVQLADYEVVCSGTHTVDVTVIPDS